MQPADLWRELGGAVPPPPKLGTRRGPLLILGGARCVWDDYASVRPWKGETMAINDIGQFIHGELAHWATLHPEYLPGWRVYRERHGYPRGTLTHAPKHREGVDIAWEYSNLSGTSGLFAANVGLLLGYEEIVLAGIPMDGSGHFFDPPWVDQSDFGRPEAIAWGRAKDYFAGRVKSLSGNTRRWLGAP